MKPLFNETRIETTATFIAAELKALLNQFTYESHMSSRLNESCPTYKDLTNSERAIATLRALALAQIEVARDLASMKIEPGDWDDLDDLDVKIWREEQLLGRLEGRSDRPGE